MNQHFDQLNKIISSRIEELTPSGILQIGL